jgi:Tfp pilus assembly protein PilN
MIRINLLPIREEARQRDIQQQLMLLVLVIVAEFLSFSMWYSQASSTVSVAESKVRQARRLTQELESEAGTLDKLRDEEAKLRSKAEVVEIIDRLKGSPAQVMMDLARNIPNRVWLTGLSFYPIRAPLALRTPILKTGEPVSMDVLEALAEPIFAIGVQGYAMGPSDVTDFAKNMKGSTRFDHVEFGEVKEVIYREADIPVQSFKLFARVSGWKPALAEAKTAQKTKKKRK